MLAVFLLITGIVSISLAQEEFAIAIERISVSSTGIEGNDFSAGTSISDDGRYVVFESDATNLVDGDNNGAGDIFLRDRLEETTQRLSVSASGEEGMGFSGSAVISGNGDYIAFSSNAANLVPDDNNGLNDIFLVERQTGQIERISTSASGEEGNGRASSVELSTDGRFIVFTSDATNLVPDDNNGVQDIFIKDRITGEIEQLSVNELGRGANDAVWDPDVSTDGRYVVFDTSAGNLVSNDTNEVYDVFLVDRQEETLQRISLSISGDQGNGPSRQPHLSSDGRFVVFQSDATNLVPDDTNNETDVFLYTIGSGQVTRISVSPTGLEGVGPSTAPTISTDGRYISFVTRADNLVAIDNNGITDVVLLDREAGTITLVSQAYNEALNDGFFTFLASVSGDGQHIAFQSNATNLVPGITNGVLDVFVRSFSTISGIPTPSLPSPYQLTYVTEGNIWLANPDGSFAEQLTTSETDCCLSWSSDGMTLYFVRHENETGQLYAYDANSGETRLLGPNGLNVTARVAPGPNGVYLYIPHHRPLPAGQDPNLVDNRACIALYRIETGAHSDIHCLDEAFIGSLIMSQDNNAVIGMLGGFEVAQIRSFPILGGESQMIGCCFDPAYYPHQYAMVVVGNSYFLGSEFNDGDGWGLFRLEEFTGALTPILLDENRLASPSIAPDGEHLLFIRGANLETLNLATGENRLVTPASEGVWRPLPMVTQVHEAFAEKLSLINTLENGSFNDRWGQPVALTAFDESAAQNLVMALNETGHENMDPQTAAAYNRLLIQEREVARAYAAFEIVRDDYAEAVVDHVNIWVGLALALMQSDPLSAGAIWNVYEDISLFGLSQIEDEAYQESTRLSYISTTNDFTALVIGYMEDDPSRIVEAYFDNRFRYSTANDAMGPFINAVQPTLDKGVRSVTFTEDFWEIRGNDESAAIQAAAVGEISEGRSELAHSQFESFDAANQFNEAATSIIDLFNDVPLVVPIAVYMRVQSVATVLTEMWLISDELGCIRDLAASAGNIAFAPPDLVLTGCDDAQLFRNRNRLRPGNEISWIENEVWQQQTVPHLLESLASYDTNARAMITAIQANDIPDALWTDLQTSHAAFNSAAHNTLVQLLPPPGESWTGASADIATDIIKAELNAIQLTLALRQAQVEGGVDNVQDEYQTAQEVINTLLITLPEDLDVIKGTGTLARGPQLIADLPLFQIVLDGAEQTIPLTIRNVGDEISAPTVGRLIIGPEELVIEINELEAGETVMSEIPVPSLTAGRYHVQFFLPLPTRSESATMVLDVSTELGQVDAVIATGNADTDFPASTADGVDESGLLTDGVTINEIPSPYRLPFLIAGILLMISGAGVLTRGLILRKNLLVTKHMEEKQ